MGYRTKLDYSSNRQISQREKTDTILSGSTIFGLPFSALTTGPNPIQSGITESHTSVISIFSGNATTTIYTWFDPRMELAAGNLSALTSLTSGITQYTGDIFIGDNFNIIDDNISYTNYTGVSFSLNSIYIVELGIDSYSGTVQHFDLDFLSANSLDYSGRTIWIDNPEITRTDRLIITDNPVSGYVWTCIDSEGMGEWQYNGSSSGSTIWTVGTGLNSAVLGGSGAIASGITSVSEGYNTTAGGNYSHAEGNYTTASGRASHAEGGIYVDGFITWVGSQAIGESSHAEGAKTIASGATSHAEGFSTTATGDFSHSEGNDTQANGLSAHAEGGSTRALGDYSHAEGQAAKANGRVSHAEGNWTTASGDTSHAEGDGTTAGGDYSHAEGYSSRAMGTTSHAEGSSTAGGNHSHSEGSSTLAGGTSSHAEGTNTTAGGNHSHSGGYYSSTYGETSFIHSHNSSIATSDKASILGGQLNLINSSNYSSIIGGGNNSITGNSLSSGIFVGSGNTITNTSKQAAIIGGFNNTVSGHSNSVIVGGMYNFIDFCLTNYSNTANEIIVGGRNNQIYTANNSFIGAGNFNTIDGRTEGIGSESSFIIGGFNSSVFTSNNSGIIGGVSNSILSTQCSYITNTLILGGSGNTYNPYTGLGYGNGGNNSIIAGIGNYLSGGSINNVVVIGGTSNNVSRALDVGSLSNTSILGGKNNNIIESNEASIIGGWDNNISGGTYSSIVGGNLNKIRTDYYSFIGGGYNNEINGHSASAIVGGWSNTIHFDLESTEGKTSETILGGAYNTISASSYSTILGGKNNEITNYNSSAILGGLRNKLIDYTIDSFTGADFNSGSNDESNYSTIIGGVDNSMTGKTAHCVILGGSGNTINGGWADETNYNSAIIGGLRNTVISNLTRSVILGGSDITATTNDTIYAPNINLDNQDGLFTSKLGINTSSPSYPLDIYGSNISRLYYSPNSPIGGVFTLSATTGLPMIGINTNSGVINQNGGISVGMRAWNDVTYPAYGKQGDTHIYSSKQANGLVLISSNGTGTEDYIDCYVGGDAGGGSSGVLAIHMHGTGATKGYVGLFTNLPTQRLDVNGNGRFRSIGSSASAGALHYTSDGTLTTNTSDERLKTNVITLTSALDKVKQLRGVTYNWTENPTGDTRIGFIAQEVNNIIPELTFVNPNSEEQYMGVHYDNVTALLVEAVKELSNELSSNTFLETQTILAEDNNIELNYNGTHESSLDGGITIINGISENNNSYFKINSDGDFVTNVNLIPKGFVIPKYTPQSSSDSYGVIGNFTRDDNYLYIKGNNGWKRVNLENF